MKRNPRPLSLDMQWVEDSAHAIYNQLVEELLGIHGNHLKNIVRWQEKEAESRAKNTKLSVLDTMFEAPEAPQGFGFATQTFDLSHLKTVEVNLDIKIVKPERPRKRKKTGRFFDAFAQPQILDVEFTGKYRRSSAEKFLKYKDEKPDARQQTNFLTLGITFKGDLIVPGTILKYFVENRVTIILNVGMCLAHELSHAVEFKSLKETYITASKNYKKYINQRVEIVSKKAEVYFLLNYLFYYMPCSIQEYVIDLFEQYNVIDAFRKLITGEDFDFKIKTLMWLKYLNKSNIELLARTTLQWFADNNIILNRIKYLRVDTVNDLFDSNEINLKGWQLDLFNEILMVLRFEMESMMISRSKQGEFENFVLTQMLDTKLMTNENSTWLLAISRKKIWFVTDLYGVVKDLVLEEINELRERGAKVTMWYIDVDNGTITPGKDNE